MLEARTNFIILHLFRKDSYLTIYNLCQLGLLNLPFETFIT